MDREKVIKGLESLRDVCNAKADMAIGEGRTAWAGYASVAHLALAILREQEAVSTIVEQPLNDTRYIFCGACKAMLAQNKSKGYKYCPWCGRAVKWDA